MNTIDRYIGIKLAQSYVLVMLVLVSLFSLLDLIEQLREVGTGSYKIANAFLFIGLTIPRRVLDLMPVTALLGSSIALAGLANNSELVAMRSAGMSIRRIGVSIMKMGGLLILLTAILEEFIAPPLQHFAHRQQALAQSGIILGTENGFWSENKRRFINIRNILHGRIPAQIDIFEFDQDGKLSVYIKADTADIRNPKQWLLTNVEEKIVLGLDMATRHYDTMIWKSFLAGRELHVLEFPVDSLSPSDLYHYIDYLQDNEEQANRYKYEFWQKICLPIATGGMVLLSIPFAFGSQRSTNKGKQILISAIIGTAIYLGNEIITNTGMILELNPFLTANIPILAILSIAYLQSRRIF